VFSTAAELSPLPEPFESLAEAEAKESSEIVNMAETIIDEVVTQLLTEAADKVLKEEE
jgi:streptomycin 6-kinase